MPNIAGFWENSDSQYFTRALGGANLRASARPAPKNSACHHFSGGVVDVLSIVRAELQEGGFKMQNEVTLSDLRNAMESINSEIMIAGKGEASNDDVLKRVKTEMAGQIKYLAPQLIDMALVKLNNEVSNRKGPRAMTGRGRNLFGDYDGIPKSVTIVKGKKKDLTKLTFREADLWLKAHAAKIDLSKHEKFKKLVEDCRPYKQSDQDTLEMAMKRKDDQGLLKFT